jgi:hypothetical protein
MNLSGILTFLPLRSGVTILGVLLVVKCGVFDTITSSSRTLEDDKYHVGIDAYCYTYFMRPRPICQGHRRIKVLGLDDTKSPKLIQRIGFITHLNLPWEITIKGILIYYNPWTSPSWNINSRRTPCRAYDSNRAIYHSHRWSANYGMCVCYHNDCMGRVLTPRSLHKIHNYSLSYGYITIGL